jgi:CelD/BcsL family acetyltransferase involved in cellulose biosynthesis
MPGPSPFGASNGYSIEPITTNEGLSDVEEDWNRLSETAGSPNVFTTLDWFRAWNQHFAGKDHGGRRQPQVLILKRDGAVAGISPLIHRRASRFGLVVRKVEFLEGPADYNDLVLGDDPASQAEAVVDYLARSQDEWDLVDLRNLRAAGNSTALIERALSRTSFIYRILPEARCPYLAIDADWSGMVRKLSRSNRHTIRRKQRRLERLATEGLRVRFIENPGAEPGLLDTLIALESQKRIGDRPVTPLFTRHPEVFRSLFDTLGPRGWIHVAVMERGDRPLAWQVSFRCGKKLWAYSTAYDPSFSRFSLGALLVPACLDYGFSHGYQEYDFLRGEEPYKMTWSTGCHETFRLLAWSPRWTSRMRAFLYLDFKTAVYRLFGRRS